MTSFDFCFFSNLLADKNMFWFSKGPAEGPLCTRVWVCKPWQAFLLREQQILSLKEGIGVPAKVELAERSGIQSCCRYAGNGFRARFPSLSLSQMELKHLEPVNLGSGIRWAEEWPLPFPLGSSSRIPQQSCYLSQSDFLITLTLTRIRRKATLAMFCLWGLPCTVVLLWTGRTHIGK